MKGMGWLCWCCGWLMATTLAAQTPTAGDVLINEIMADPDPAVGLPAVEYLELYNASAASYNLANWQVVDASGQSVLLPAYVLVPDAYVLLCAAAVAPQLTGYGAVLGTSMPTNYLNNDGDSLRLIAPGGVLVHTVRYRDSWYRDALKAQGGYSLELSDPANPCAAASNWAASNAASGGTPGMRNSIWGVYRDQQGPRVVGTAVQATQIDLLWDEVPDATRAAQTGNYQIQPAVSVVTALPAGLQTSLLLGVALDSSLGYQLTIRGMTDCVGNRMRDTTLVLQLARAPLPGELVLSELLVDPAPGGSRYIEVNNRSQATLQLQGLAVQRMGAVAVRVVDAPTTLSPGAYLALTHDTHDVKQRYHPISTARLFATSRNLPAWNAGADSVLLYGANGALLDAIAYSRTWHHPQLASTEGVALERRSPHRPSQDPANWQSAASNVRHGTPGYANSQGERAADGGRVWLADATLVPEASGPERVLHIQYAAGLGGHVAQVLVYDYQGRQVRQLVAAELLGTASGEWQWGGEDDSGRRLPLGIYVVVVQLYDGAGHVAWAKKIPCVLSGRP